MLKINKNFRQGIYIPIHGTRWKYEPSTYSVTKTARCQYSYISTDEAAVDGINKMLMKMIDNNNFVPEVYERHLPVICHNDGIGSSATINFYYIINKVDDEYVLYHIFTKKNSDTCAFSKFISQTFEDLNYTAGISKNKWYAISQHDYDRILKCEDYMKQHKEKYNK